MKVQLLSPPTLEGRLRLPASKSISNRALMMQALCPNTHFPIQNLADCDDTLHMQAGIRQKAQQAAVIDIGATGTAMRFLTAYLAIGQGQTLLTGDRRMQERPIGLLVEALRQLGADITYAGIEGFPPLQMRGKTLEGGLLSIDSGVSSQYISALLMIAPCLEKGLTLELKGEVASRSYIQLTLELMRHYGASAEWTSEHALHIAPGGYRDVPLTVESDWSAASYWYELAALYAQSGQTVNLRLEGLRAESAQGDCRCVELFHQLGVQTHFDTQGATLTGTEMSAQLLEYDFTDCPDIAQTLVVTACLLHRPFHFSGLKSLRIKETDRLAALQTELRKLGFLIEEEASGVLCWKGQRISPEAHPSICTYNDHRMAMAFAPAAVRIPGIIIENTSVVHKSYPAFWKHLEQVGFTLQMFE